MQTPRVTLKDIAKVAGVDISTVSRSLSGAYGINKDTRELVLAAAAKLDYRPNRIARGLAIGRSHTFGLIVSDIRNPFFAEIARGAQDAAYAAGCDLILCNSDLNSEKQMKYVQSMVEKGVDGVLMNSVTGLNRTQQESLSSSGIPVVLLNRPRSISNFSTITCDNVQGGFFAGQKLTELGHRIAVHLTGPRDHGNMRERARGFLRGFKPVGSMRPLVIHGEQNFGGGYKMMQAALARQPKLTAVFAANDAMAFGAVRAILEARIRIPLDISIVGFDNVELSTVMHPPLTTIHQPKYEMGKAAIEMLIDFAAHHGTRLPEHRVMGVSLIERDSCAQAPTRVR